ncbi:hypothetical protein GCK32_014012 [Trichostrongylus colubriformis]|uniref:Uncharacterized protein n=1 Tax=Trichostrongylus colubriformis TaxID=6319 RepID=A0AAN8F9B0_TRICO
MGQSKQQLEIISENGSCSWKISSFVPFSLASACSYHEHEGLWILAFKSVQFLERLGSWWFLDSRSDFKHGTFEEIMKERPSMRRFFQKEIGISDTACTMHYRVKFNDGMKPFHYFRFDQAGYAFYVLVTRDFTKSHMWRNSTKEEFEQVPKKCHNGDDSQVSLVPLCNRKPTDSKIIQN